MHGTIRDDRNPRSAPPRATAGRTPLAVVCAVLCAVVCAALLTVAFVAAWRHVRFTPRLVDSWPTGAGGFGLSCAVAVLAGRAGLVRSLGRATRAMRLAGSVACGAVLLLGSLYGLAVVPPRWCYQSTSPHCGTLPGAAEAGLTFLGTLIGAYFASSVLAGVPSRVRQLARRGGRGSGTGARTVGTGTGGTGTGGTGTGGTGATGALGAASPPSATVTRTRPVSGSRSARTPRPAPAAFPTAAVRRRVGRSARP